MVLIFVFVDTPPRLEQASMAAASAANLILIPCIRAINDLDTLETTIELLHHAGQKTAIVVLNSAPSRGARKEQAEEVLRDKRIIIAPIAFGHRTAFPDSAALAKRLKNMGRKLKLPRKQSTFILHV